ncbi:MAG: mannitol dehydrogenase family protein [Firmicutes bacterium]|nr:mannitol dehydrogenase family protein [Bacillota bacterium]
MKLNRNELKNKEAWAEIGIGVPNYDVAEAVVKAVEAPRWIHFGIGNIFRIFLGGIADELLEKGLLDRGITCIETFDFDVVDKIYTPYDDLVLSVILKSDGTRDMKVLGSLAEGIKADPGDAEQWGRMLAAFASQDLQLITFTITEKGYALTSSDGVYLPYVQKDIENGPDQARGAMGVVAAGLFRRFEEGALPVALVSMDNCANNGRLLKESVVTMAEEWAKLGFVPEAFVEYVSDEETVAFCCTMIDKITPRPSEQIADDLEALGIEDMQPVITSKRTYIAPFANGEGPQYVVIEDRFPNGRPMLEEGFGVYLGDYDTVSRSERMKVTALLNPVHSATGPIGVVLGIDLFADMLEQVPAVLKLAKAVAYQEGLPMVKDPGILSPQAFVDELFEDRFPNKYLGDTNLRLSTDVSQGVGVRFGETIKAYVAQYGSAEQLTAIPLGIAGWLRYMLGVDDQGKAYELAPDPMNDEITGLFATIRWGDPTTVTDQLKPILSNERVFFTDLYQAGLGEKIEGFFKEMIQGPGSTLATIEKYFA